MFDILIATDLVLVLTCTTLVLRFGRLSHSHPATIYLLFHVYTFSIRLWVVAMGAPTLFSESGPLYLGVTHEEIYRAGVLADIALVMMTCGFIKASSDDRKLARRTFAHAEKQFPNLSFDHITRVVRITFPLGLLGMFAFTYIPGLDNLNVYLGGYETSSGVMITRGWVGLSLLALIYWSGFRWPLMAVMLTYLAIMSVQGSSRYRVILPVIFMVQVYLDRRGLRWPPARAFAVFVVVGILFFPLKDIGKMAREGHSIEEIASQVTSKITDAGSGEHEDQQFMDQFASALTLLDEDGKIYYGTTYVSLLTLPIPRVLWKDKPDVNEYVSNFTRPWRPMKEAGMIVTYLGEAYANFWYFGIVLIPFLLAYVVARFHFHAYRSPYYSVARFSYLLIAVNLIQVYRDGLISMFIFTFVNMMPLMAIVMLHRFLPVKQKLRISTLTPVKSGAGRLSEKALPS